VQGNPTKSNVGDPSGALTSYQRAINLASAVRTATPRDAGNLRTLAMAYRQRGDVLALTGNKNAALADAQQSQEIFSEIVAAEGASADDRLQAGIALVKLGDLLGNPNFENLGRTSSASLQYEKALDAFQALDKATPNDLQIRRYLGLTLERIGTMHQEAKRWPDAEKAYRESFSIRQALAEREPLHRDIQRDLGIAHEKLGNVLMALSGPTVAVAEQRQALLVFERLAAADPSDVNAARTVAISRQNLGETLRESGTLPEAIDLLTKALATHRSFLAQDPRNVGARCDAADVEESLGDTLLKGAADGKAPPAACDAWRDSLRDNGTQADGAPSCAAPEAAQRLSAKLAGC
jgi:tetratricopeptide (TPR) repeat protein